jgi:hypothetical protein
LRSFETIGTIANLDDQEDVMDELKAVTKDGIIVVLKGIKFRYRLISNQQKTLDNPYPFLEAELDKMAYNISVREQGLPPWRGFVKQSLTTIIKEKINMFTIDELTAPRTDATRPWVTIHADLLLPAHTATIRSAGAEITWLDLGHIHIEPEVVDESRVGFWAADWVGNAEARMAYSTGKRMAYQDQARAEAQAELIMSIAHGLEGINFSTNTSENVRKLLLSRTSEIISSFTPSTQPGMVNYGKPNN